MGRPNFFIIGATKAGTTSLYAMLAQHPDVFLAKHKEPHFFSYPERYARGMSWYQTLFDGSEGALAIGEASTTYSWSGVYPNTVERLLASVPDPKIIYLVREPLARAQSLWIELQNQGFNIHRQFHKSLKEDRCLVDSSLYLKQISAYVRHISQKQILVIFFEDFVANPEDVVRRCFAFLDVRPLPDDQLRGLHENPFAGKRRDRAAMRWIRRAYGFRMIRDQVVSPYLRRALRPVITEKILAKPPWNDEARQWFVNQIKSDSAELLRSFGKPPSFWGSDLDV